MIHGNGEECRDRHPYRSSAAMPSLSPGLDRRGPQDEGVDWRLPTSASASPRWGRPKAALRCRGKPIPAADRGVYADGAGFSRLADRNRRASASPGSPGRVPGTPSPGGGGLYSGPVSPPCGGPAPISLLSSSPEDSPSPSPASPQAGRGSVAYFSQRNDASTRTHPPPVSVTNLSFSKPARLSMSRPVSPCTPEPSPVTPPLLFRNWGSSWSMTRRRRFPEIPSSARAVHVPARACPAWQ
jgi:hypothetical protein